MWLDQYDLYMYIRLTELEDNTNMAELMQGSHIK